MLPLEEISTFTKKSQKMQLNIEKDFSKHCEKNPIIKIK